jgi:hypothetical protein
VAAVQSGPNWTPPLTIPIKKTNIQNWLEQDERDPGFQLLLFFLNKGSTVIYFYLFSLALAMLYEPG